MSASVEFSIEPRDATKIVPKQNRAENPADHLTLNNSTSFMSKQSKKGSKRAILNEFKVNNNQK